MLFAHDYDLDNLPSTVLRQAFSSPERLFLLLSARETITDLHPKILEEVLKCLLRKACVDVENSHWGPEVSFEKNTQGWYNLTSVSYLSPHFSNAISMVLTGRSSSLTKFCLYFWTSSKLIPSWVQAFKNHEMPGNATGQQDGYFWNIYLDDSFSHLSDVENLVNFAQELEIEIDGWKLPVCQDKKCSDIVIKKLQGYRKEVENMLSEVMNSVNTM